MHTEYSGLPVAVLGFGRAGRAATDFFLARGARVTVYDEGEMDETRTAPYRARGVGFAAGAFPDRFSEALLVRSPVIRPDIPPILASLAAGAALTSETELFLAHCKGRVIGITGSDGKTTTANLAARLLCGAGRTVHLGGNNGTPLLPRADSIKAEDFVVLELSSFQLMTATCSPDIAVMTNITPNHLNWHRDMEEYTAAKCRIFNRGASRLVIPAALRNIGAGGSISASVFTADETHIGAEGEYRLPIPDTFLLKGAHNRENLSAAYAAVREFVPFETVGASLAGFRGVPHRLQYVDTVAGVAYYNSSIDTTPSRTAAALHALGGHPIVIAGGRGKGVSFLPLRATLGRMARAVFLYGEAAEEMEEALIGCVPIHRFSDFAAAFCAASALAQSGDTVLLSPACTAFDQFRDFEQRGDVFCALVQALHGEKETDG